MFNIVLVNPEIPPNTGNVGRLCLATGSRLHLIRPLGFSIDDKQVRRAGLDYWEHVDLQLWDSLDELRKQVVARDADARFFFISKKATKIYWDIEFEEGDYLVFGRETKGLPEELLEQEADRCLRIPMVEGTTRSLNLATSVSAILFEALRQVEHR